MHLTCVLMGNGRVSVSDSVFVDLACKQAYGIGYPFLSLSGKLAPSRCEDAEELLSSEGERSLCYANTDQVQYSSCWLARFSLSVADGGCP